MVKLGHMTQATLSKTALATNSTAEPAVLCNIVEMHLLQEHVPLVVAFETGMLLNQAAPGQAP